MSYTISMLIDVELREDLPAAVESYLDALASEDRSSITPSAGGRTPAGGLPSGDWFGDVTVRWVRDGEGGWPSRLHLVGDFHDDFMQHQYHLIRLLAAHSAADGPFCACWDTIDPSSFEVFAARGGHLLSQSPAQPWEGDSAARPLLDVSHETMHSGQRADLQRLGASPAVLATHDALDDPDVLRGGVHPSLARYLLVRSLARVLRDHGAEAALGPLLEVLDAGADRLAGRTAPGWRIGETEVHYDAVHTPSLRQISGGLSEIGRALPGSWIDTGPVELRVGQILRTLRAVVLRQKAYEGAVPQPGPLSKDVPIAAGVELRVHKVYPRGHATALMPDGGEVDAVSPHEIGVLYEIISDPAASDVADPPSR